MTTDQQATPDRAGYRRSTGSPRGEARRPRGQLVDIPDSYTLLPLDQPVRFAKVIREFLLNTDADTLAHDRDQHGNEEVVPTYGAPATRPIVNIDDRDQLYDALDAERPA